MATTTTAVGPGRSRPAAPSRRRQGFRRWFADTGWRHLVGAVVLVFALFPVVFVVSASLNPLGTLTASNSMFSRVSLVNFRALFSTPVYPYPSWFLNTMVISVTTAVLQVLVACLSAYAFSRFRFAGRRVGLLGLLLIQMFPQVLAAVAIFLLVFEIGTLFPAVGLGSSLGLVFVYMGGALGVSAFLIKGFFDTVPKELDEAMKVDGAGHARIFFTMILPLSAPVLAVVVLLSFITTLNEFLVASIVLTQPEDQTLAVGLYRLVSDSLNAQWGFFAAGAILGTIPPVLLFLWLQKYVVAGLTAGAGK
ncbi:sugar ABC transporter permease [Aquipuribacter hungaricus]|uniref:Sugar ABC transporter permease n=1 Tax=Aquipuribacter hungaricus TaxID=545624 RepID=A0ABV7WMY7_9MICO